MRDDEQPNLSVKQVLQRAAASFSPQLSVAGVPADGFDRWRERLRAKVWEVLGGGGELVAPEVEVALRVEEPDYVRSLLRYQTEPGVITSAWLLEPAGASKGTPKPGFLALHGHGAGKDDLLGIAAEDDTEALDHITKLNYTYGHEMARRGYVVLAPDARGFGERRADGCHIPGLVSLYQGRIIAGQRLWDDLRSLDVLGALPGVDPTRLGCGGLSEGGKRALFLAAVDDRVQVAVVSGYFTSVRVEIGAWDRLAGWDICNALPGLLRWADLPDVAALIAPRHLVIENGRDDPLYTLAGVREGFEQASAAWATLGVPDHVELDLFDGLHEWSGRLSYRHLDRVLRPTPVGR